MARAAMQQMATRTTRIGTSVGGDSEHQHNACRRFDGNLDHSPPLALGVPLSRRPRSCLRARPHLRRNDTGNWLRADIRDDLPDRSGRHHAAICGHPARPAVEDRLIQRAVGAAIAPAAIDQARAHPPGRTAAVAAVAVHRAEDLSAIGDDCGIGCDGILDLDGWRLVAAGGDVIRIAHGHWHSTGVGALARRQQNSRPHAPRTTHHARIHKPKIQTMPPWLVCRARSDAKSAGGRTSAGSSDRTSPDSRNQSPPMPAYTAMYCFPSGARNEIGAPTTPEPTLNFHSCRPVLASAALNQPSSVPKNTTSPAVTTLPLHTGNFSLMPQTLRPRAASQAMNSPM